MQREQFANWKVFDDVGRRKYITAVERNRFLAVADDLPLASRALCHVLAYTGCRVSEALALRRHQLDTERLVLVLRTLKRRKLVFRAVPIPAALAEMLLKLEPEADGQFWRMHRVTAWRTVKRVMTAAAVDGPMSCCRGLRHGFGIRAAERHTPGNLIQKWMGHSSYATTAIYIDATGAEERKFAERLWG